MLYFYIAQLYVLRILTNFNTGKRLRMQTAGGFGGGVPFRGCVRGGEVLKGNGKAWAAQKGKGKTCATVVELHFHLTTRPRARMHERNEADFPVGGPGGLTPPNLR